MSDKQACALKMKMKCKAKSKDELRAAIFNLELAAKLLRAQASSEGSIVHNAVWVYEGDVIDALIHLQTFMKANKISITDPDQISRILKDHTKT